MKTLMMAAAAAALLAACGGADGQAQPATKAGGDAPVETKAANAPDQQPAFAGQTRAPEVKANVAYEVSDYVTGLQKPWGLAFLPDGALLVSEKAGRLRLFADGRLSDPLAGVPQVDANGQGGLLGLAVDPDFARNGLVYMAFSERQADGRNNTAVARGRLVTAAGQPPRLEGTEVIWRQTPSIASRGHFGSRLVFARDGTLYVTTGDRQINESRPNAQRLDTTIGKVVRINADGSVPKDNPFVGREGVRPEIYSSGHRNIQAAALHPQTGELWEVEHGTRGGDELNIVRPGKNYGWPDVAYGIEYGGGAITGGITRKEGIEQPIYYWDPVIAPSGMAFYTHDAAPAWKGSLFVGGLGPKYLARLTLDGDRVVGEERLLTEVGERLRDVVVGPDGALYVATDNEDGRVLKVTPKR
ncbi:putative glucose dehydrogenase-B, periplasmic protein [Phenylobacterium zucineum HLK1]|uniref:Putative glucose dehydrogenase-B, periplasmic protein n=1 Tax=Phenylobacterium zucineum (strain HLK1) TaxID=450851 RepID=B4RF37_PHEZH|nr:PQQ-dependent sugar dehydrogenase [Phenylobacterium zucineum]ACG77025.1 putative glucose dehydrogenase-B, periplasmic protein [Phenylobacterium zucineum HLK1]